jgi:hypothetical protein
MRRLGEDARRYAADTEPAEGPESPARIDAKRAYLKLAHEQLASELDCICTACWLGVGEPDKKYLN